MEESAKPFLSKEGQDKSLKFSFFCLKTKSYRVGTNYDGIKGKKVGKEGVAVKTYQLELYRKSFENRALQLFKCGALACFWE